MSVSSVLKQIGNIFLILSIQFFLGRPSSTTTSVKNSGVVILFSVFGAQYIYMALASAKSLRDTGYDGRIVLHLYKTPVTLLNEYLCAWFLSLNIEVSHQVLPKNALFKKNSAKLNSINHFAVNEADLYLMYFDADCIFNKNPLQIVELLNFAGICLTPNRSPAIRYKKLTGQMSHFGTLINFDLQTPQFFTLPNGGFISANLKRNEIVKCLTGMTDDYHSSDYVDDQAFLRKHLYLNHIIPLMLDSRVCRSAKDLSSNQCLFTHYGGSNRYKIAIQFVIRKIHL